VVLLWTSKRTFHSLPHSRVKSRLPELALAARVFLLALVCVVVTAKQVILGIYVLFLQVGKYLCACFVLLIFE
jgi:hypothetical protein